ncbi:hypothetical protein RYX36_035287, partial [Vicia faba]
QQKMKRIICKNSLKALIPVVLMVFCQIGYAAVNIMYKLAINDGMSMRVAAAYRLCFAAAFTIPLAIFFDRKERPKITWKVLYMAFLCGLFGGSLLLNLYGLGLTLTSATFMLSMLNLVPGVTFIMAISFGLEKLNWRLAEGKAKVVGTIVSIGGAMLMIFYKGVEINIWNSNINLMHPLHDQNGLVEPIPVNFSSKLLGVPCGIGSCCSFSLWLIIQTKLNEEYPSHHSSTALMSTMGAIQATVLALCFDREWSQWKLDYNIRLLTIVYSGAIASGLLIVVIAWCIKIRGPLFASVFNPLQLLLVAISAYLLLDEKLYLGSVFGAVLIVCGIYAVLWSKRRELENKKKLFPLETDIKSEVVEFVIPNPYK